ncbi:MAG: hypothetical protein IKV27_04515 [Lachnospiraceae bacterium]|nr:hypothetical protein [Lachnospiraceae bacterium]
MRKKLWKIILLIFIVIVMSSFAWIRCKDYLDKEKYKQKWEENFIDNQKKEPYSLGMPLEEMDFDVYHDYFYPQISIAINHNYTQSIILPCDVEYYNSKNDQNPTLTLKKGSTIYVVTNNSDVNEKIGYGLVCWPDYEHGWRYGSPFITENVAINTREMPKYYVKTKQLKQVAKAFYKANTRQLSHDVRHRTLSEFSTYYISYIDRKLYENGVFCAPIE